MKKTLIYLVVLAVLIPSGWINPMPGSAHSEEADPLKLITIHKTKQTRLAEPASSVGSGFSEPYDWLYPQDIDPPESCHVPNMAPLGQDLEMMLGPWYGPNALLALAQGATWNDEANFSGVSASTNLDVIALNTEELVATWRDGNWKVHYATWGAGSGWVIQAQLGSESASGKPALLSRGPTHWAIFARFSQEIRVIQWYMGSLGSWEALPGINDAASDPVVISQDAGHMAVFYRTAGGEVKFSEWEGAWLSQPVSLGQPTAGISVNSIASELSAVSRNDSHAAVFGVDATGGLWYRERTDQNELDWSDTAWVKLLDGVEVAKPAVATRHANHIGVVVKDNNGQPYYTRWTRVESHRLYLPMVVRTSGVQTSEVDHNAPNQALSVVASSPAGWSTPVPLGEATFTSPLTLVPRGKDSLVVLGVQSDSDSYLYEIVWTEDAGWGSWQIIAGGSMKEVQVPAAVNRRINDIMLLGRYDNDQVWYKHYTSLDKPVTDEALSSSLEGLPRAQTLAFVEGRWIWVSLTRQAITGTWQVEAREISTGITGYLDLGHDDSGQAVNRAAVAGADLDVDGNTEVVVATLQSNQSDIDLSVLELSFPDPNTLVISASPLFTWPDPLGGDDVNVAIGDLDGDQEQDDVIVGYQTSSSMHFGIFQYTDFGLALQGSPTTINYHDWCGGLINCTVGEHDLEMTIGRVKKEIAPPLEREQLVVLDTSDVNLNGVSYTQDWVVTRRLITETWNLEPVVDCNLLDPSTNVGNPSTMAGAPYSSALGSGDMDADGLEDIVYSFGDRLAVLTIDDTQPYSQTCVYRPNDGLQGQPDTARSLVMGDVDNDGRSEATVGYRDLTTSIKMFEMVEGKALRVSAVRTINSGYTVLVADTDNDTQLAELAGCKTFAEIHVVGVVNGPPRWYENGAPIQSSGGVYGRTETGGGGSSDGTTLRYGGSLSLGFEYEFNVPVTAIKIGEIRAQLTQEFMGSSGTKQTDVSYTTLAKGYEYEAISLGMVVYNSTAFTCYYYDVYPPAAPDSKTRAMLCTPTGRDFIEKSKSLEDWHVDTFKSTAGPSWVDVGHRSPGGVHTNDLEVPGNYALTLPVDASRVKYTWDEFTPIEVSYSSLGGFTTYWHISDMEGGETEDITTFEENTTLSVGATAGNVTLDVAGTFGVGWESSTVTSWESTLEMGGAVEYFQDSNRLCYAIIPFVYEARAKTQAGVVYPYLEMDYYVPLQPYPCAMQAETGIDFGPDSPFQ